MKNVILAMFAFLTAFTSKAQDGYDLSDKAYRKIGEAVNNLDSLEARKFADRIAQTAKADFAFIEAERNEQWVKYKYVSKKYLPLPENWYWRDCKRCLEVVFDVYHKGANKALEIRGERYLKFRYADGKYLDLFPIWKEKFLPSATPKKSLENFRYRDVKSRKMDVDVRLQKKGAGWQIHNWSH